VDDPVRTGHHAGVGVLGWWWLLRAFVFLVVPLFAVIAVLWAVGNRRAKEHADRTDRDNWTDRR
jgi:hypothetical protein